VRIWQDGFAFVVLSWGNTVVLYSGNYDSHEQTKTQLAANRWYRMKIVVTKDADTRFGKYDLYVDGQYVGTMHSSEFDMIRECGGNCILIGKFSESILDRVGLCWRNIYVTFGPGGASATGGATTGLRTQRARGAHRAQLQILGCQLHRAPVRAQGQQPQPERGWWQRAGRHLPAILCCCQ
jgi:threonine dehydratase